MSDKKVQRMGWMVERLLEAHPGGSVSVRNVGPPLSYQAELVIPSGHTKAPCAADAFEAIQKLYQHVLGEAHRQHREHASYMTALGWTPNESKDNEP